MMKLKQPLTSLAWRISKIFGMVALLALFGMQTLPASAATSSTSSYVRLIQASPDVGAVSIFVDGTEVASNTGFATVTDYAQVPADSQNVQIVLIGKGADATVLKQPLSVQAGLAYTVAALGTMSTGFSTSTFVDDNLIAGGMAKVRVYNLYSGMSPLSVASDVSSIVSGLRYGQATNYLPLAAGSYMFNVTLAQNNTPMPASVTLKTNTVTSLFAVAALNDNSKFQVVNAQVNGMPGMAGTGSDPHGQTGNWQLFTSLMPWILGLLALGGMSAGVVVPRLLVSRKQNVLLSGLPLCGRCLRREKRPYKTPSGNAFFIKPLLHIRTIWVTVCLVPLIVALVLNGCGQSAQKASPTAHLLIPTIGVDAPIESVGLLSSGNVATPTQSPWSNVGWYNGGPLPGQRGSAVIDGHLNRTGGDPAVFWNLHELHVGDKVMVVDGHGKTFRFSVTRIMLYPGHDAPVQDIFGNKAGSFLNLMTCAGDWMPIKHETTLRLVVYTSLD